MRLMHIPMPRGFDDQWWLYISAFFFCVAGLLQFPFKEEEVVNLNNEKYNLETLRNKIGNFNKSNKQLDFLELAEYFTLKTKFLFQ